MFKLSFTLRVLAISFIVLALPLLVDSFIFFQTSYYDSIQEAKATLKELANFKKFTLEEIQPVKQVLLKELDYFLNLEKKLDDRSKQELDKQLESLTKHMKDLQIFVLKKVSANDYKVVASSLPEFYETTFKSYMMLEKISLYGEGSFVRYVYSRASDSYVPYLFVGRHVRSKTGKDYILVVSTEMTFEFQSILKQTQENQDIESAILNHDGVVLDSTLSALKGQFFDYLSPERKKEIKETHVLGDIALADRSLTMIKGEDDPFFEFVFNKKLQIAYRTYVNELGLFIVSFASKEAFFRHAVGHFLVLYSIYALVFIVGGGITYWLSLWISRPLRQLGHVMQKVGQGNLDVRFKEMPMGFDINLLGQMFNQTLDTLLENIQRTEDERVKKEIYEKELEIGRRAQKNLLPATIPQIFGAEGDGVYLPVKETGGDFYDFFVRKTENGKEALFFGVTDAAGKGISACLFAISFRSLLLSYANIYEDVGIALSKTNNDFLEDAGETGMFIKALHGVFYPETKTLYYYSCGNIPGIVRKANGHLISLQHSGMAIGLKPSDGFHPDEIQLEKDDFVLFFTDGLLEALNEKHQYFSERRFRNLLQSKNWLSANEMLDGIVKEVNEFTKGVPREQEITIVVVRVT